ncbi:MAG: UvrB/UvrC motif-containing protein [Treponema sp.]
MQCDLCHNEEAVIFIEQVGPNGTRKVNLCLKCASERGIASPNAAPQKINIDAIFKEIDEKIRSADPDARRLCPVCGKNLALIKKSLAAGCPECYEVFKDEIKTVMSAHGMAGLYTGSLPKRLAGFRNALTDRNDLQTKLDEAVRAENYEKAAVYRDYLRALEKGSVADAGEEAIEEGETR